MTRTEHLLQILSEECNETAQRVSKALRFSLTEVQPGQHLTNADRIIEEFLDAMAVVEMLEKIGALPVWNDERMEAHIEAKKMKVEQYLFLSKEMGTLQ